MRQRKSEKWRQYPPEVLPSFVAEMGFARLTMGTSPELMEETVRRMASAL